LRNKQKAKGKKRKVGWVFQPYNKKPIGLSKQDKARRKIFCGLCLVL